MRSYLHSVACFGSSSVFIVVLPYLCSVAEAAEFIPLGGIGDNCVSCRDVVVSADGSAAAFTSVVDGNHTEAFRWTQDEGAVNLGGFVPGGGSVRTRDISGDGIHVAGEVQGAYAFLWTIQDGMNDLGIAGQAAAISSDNLTIAGFVFSPGGGIGGPYRWTAAEGVQPIVLPPGLQSFAPRDVSKDGSMLIGGGNASTFDSTHAFRWSEDTGFVPMGTLPGSPSDSSYAHAYSPDGSIIVGRSDSDLGVQAFRWTEEGGLVGLGDLPGGALYSSALAASLNGEFVVGESETSVGREAFVWDAQHGMRNLRQVLVDEFELGGALEGWVLAGATDISLDGETIVGWGTNPRGLQEPWLVQLTTPIPEPGSMTLALALIAPLMVQRRRRYTN